MKSRKANPKKNNAARAKNSRGKKSGFIQMKDAEDNMNPVSAKEENSLQAMHAQIQREINRENKPDTQMESDEKQVMLTASENEVMKAGDDEMVNKTPEEDVMKTDEEKMK